MKIRFSLLCLCGFGAMSGYVHGGALLDKANSLFNKGKYAESIPAYRSAIRGGENRALCRFNLGNAYFRLDSLPQAITAYRACLAAAPGFFKGHVNLASAYYALNDAPATIAALKRALDIEPGDARARMMLGASLRQAGALPDAVTEFERAHGIGEKSPDLPLIIGEIWRELGDASKAIEWLGKVPEGSPQRASAVLLLADLHLQGGNREGALFHLRKAEALQPGQRWIRWRIVSLLSEMEKPLVALETAAAALRAFPDFTELQLLAGNLAVGQGRLAEAELYYGKAAAAGSAQAVIGLESIRRTRLAAVLKNADEAR